ncbi:MAG: hypothetical protein H7Z13_18575 [Ferruginibacter sp.]|nr:hypothetical protein [Ferruginibacter sp.]
MNKFTILISMLFLSMGSIAQPFLGVKMNNSGGGLQAGYQAQFDRENLSISGNSILFTVGMNASFLNAEKPKTYYLTAGYVYAFADKDAFTITANAGPAIHRYKDFSEYDNIEKGQGTITAVQDLSMMYNIEIGKDWHIGRLFINATYSKKILFGVGLKAFLR